MRSFWGACLLAAAPAAAFAGADVQLGVGGLMSIRAADVPLREILDRVEDKTGMKTIYDGIPPAQLITVTLADLTPAAAVAELLEGRGVRFAMSTDRVGARVLTLMLTTVKVEFKQLPPPPPETAELPYMSETNGVPTDELPPWLPERPAGGSAILPPGMGVRPPGAAAVPPPGAEGGVPMVPEPDATMPPPAPTAAPSNLMPTPVPYAVSPFTPQGPGPIIFAPPGTTAAVAAPPPLMTPLPGPSTAERQPWE